MLTLSLFRKQQQVEDLIRFLLKNLEDLALHHREALTAYLDGNLAECEQRAHEVDRLESELDDLQRQIQQLLLREALMPDSRDDVLRLLTKLDRIPGQCRHSLKELLLELPPLPNDFRASLLLLLHKTHSCLRALSATVDSSSPICVQYRVMPRRSPVKKVRWIEWNSSYWFECFEMIPLN